MKVSICIASYRRPEGLARLVSQLDRLTFERSPTPGLEVVVVDNDPGRSAAAVCDTLRPRLRLPLRYEHEPERGISFARNRAVRSVRDGADFLAFIDDDETPEPGWLDELLHVQRTYGADVVSGPVEPRFEGKVPAWVVRGGFFDAERFATGEVIAECGTGNVLIRTRLLREVDRLFDERLALTGGEDVEFFRRVSRAGYRIVWADDALVHEWIPQSRATAPWLLRRAYRIGISFGAHGGAPGDPARLRAARALKAVARVAQQLLLLPLAGLTGRHAFMKSLQSISFRVGQLAGMLGLRYEEYRILHGR